ncbi:MAG: hypothetical protein JWO84_385 [Parcubacteria group bacterium]|nr:hypothetical protein [Parcubacteria group bacterium]
MRSIPISIDHVEVEERTPNDGHLSRPLHDEEMVEIMRGCLEGLRRLGAEAREFIAAVKVTPSVTSSGCWPPAPILPIEYEIRVNLGDAGSPFAAEVPTQLKATGCLSARDTPELLLSERIAVRLVEVVKTTIDMHAHQLKRSRERWERVFPPLEGAVLS